jgi:ubiquitin C-terminal hydrolase
MVYQCGAVGTIREPFVFWGMPLPAQRKGKAIDISVCIDYCRRQELMEGENALLCERCGVLEDILKKVVVWRFPPVLVIHLERFTERRGFLEKNNIVVHYPMVFDARHYAASLEHAHGVYDLIAVVCHAGTLEGGHYWCMVRDRAAADVWYHVSDSDVRQVHASDAYQACAYVLFYQQR